MVKKLIRRSDVMIENFRPGVMKKIGLDYETVKSINPRMVYGTVTGYGATGPWNKKPGQDLLVQSISGLAWLNGDDGQPPMPFALSLADSYSGRHYGLPVPPFQHGPGRFGGGQPFRIHSGYAV